MSPFATYARALREEPKLRAYLIASIIDDIGLSVAGWAGVLLMTNLFKDQRARASVMLPTLVCFLAGALIAGPLADWERDPQRIGIYRWRLVVWGRILETLGLGTVVLSVARGITLSNILPYMVLSAFMKTALGPTRAAFLVDLLRREEVRFVDGESVPMLDESDRPLKVKTHLLTLEALVQALRSGSALLGLLLGGVVVSAVHQRYEILFAIDIGTTLVFIALIATTCRPGTSSSGVRLRELFAFRPSSNSAMAIFGSGIRHFGSSAREVFGYLRQPAMRPLLWILFGDWLVEVLDEFYSGEMIVKHILGGSDDALRYARSAWALATMAALLVLPAIARRVGGLGRLFLAAMLLDGFVMLLAGQLAHARSVRFLVPFAGAIAVDHGLTATSETLATLASASASGASIRGRIFAVVPILAIVGDILAESLSTPLSERIGVPTMVSGLGGVQVVLMLIVAALGGTALRHYGLSNRRKSELVVSP